MTVIQRFTAENVGSPADPVATHPFTQHMRAFRVLGPFIVERPDGEQECSDGWVALDKQGLPYAIPQPAGV